MIGFAEADHQLRTNWEGLTAEGVYQYAKIVHHEDYAVRLATRRSNQLIQQKNSKS